MPMKWMTAKVEWGATERHLDLAKPEHRTIEFHNSYLEARGHAQELVKAGHKLVAILELRSVLAPEEIKCSETVY